MTEFSYTVVIPFHGPVGLIEPTLRALDSQTTTTLPRVIVSDDASPVPVEAGIDGLGLERLTVDVVRSDDNGGPGAARNRATALVDTPWVAYIDGDVVPAPDWAERMQALIDRTDADVVEGVSHLGGGDEVVTPFTHATETAPPDRHGAGNIAFKTDLLRSIGGFDERYFDTQRRIHFREDADITFRLERLGTKYDFDPDLVVTHPPLPASFWTPVKLARRYAFDALLAREHPEQFREMHVIRRAGPVSLRAARHHAAVSFVLATVVVAAGLINGNRVLRVLGVGALATSWAANIVATCWNRTVRPVDVVPVIAVSALVPFTYTRHFLRGVLTYRHWPRF